MTYSIFTILYSNYPTRSFINPLIDSIQNLLKIFSRSCSRLITLLAAELK